MTEYERIANAVQWIESKQVQEYVTSEWERLLATHPDIESDVFRTYAQQALDAGDVDFEAIYGRYTELLNAAEQAEAAKNWQPPYDPELYPTLHEPPSRPTMNDAANELMAQLRSAKAARS